MGSSENSDIAEIFGGELKIVEMGEDERTLQIYNLRSQSLKSPHGHTLVSFGVPSPSFSSSSRVALSFVMIRETSLSALPPKP